jgi:putative DNA primase/helicase
MSLASAAIDVLSRRPHALKVISENIPEQLKKCRGWVVWKYVLKADKWTKPPFQTNGQHASSTDPKTHNTFENVWAAYQSGKFDGIGFCLSPDNYLVGIDLDHCLVDGKPDALAELVLADFAGTYAEVSPSDEGLRIFAEGIIPSAVKTPTVEMYSGGRYLTVTGHRLSAGSTILPLQGQLDRTYAAYAKPKAPAPAPPAVKPSSTEMKQSDQDFCAMIAASKQGDTFQRLFAGDISGYGSQSEADLAFVSIVMWWSMNDTSMTDAIFRQSGLFREKWDVLHGAETYGQMTLKRAWTGSPRDLSKTIAPINNLLTSNSTRRFKFISSAALEFVAAKWVIKNILEEQATMSLFGAPGSMKSFIVIDMGLCVATGKDWHGHKVKQGPVLYICGEGKAGIKKRIAAWEIHHGVKAPLFFVSTIAAQLLDPASLSDVEVAADEITATHGKPSFIIIDTLNRNFGPGDENSTSDMTAFVQAIDQLCDRLGCAFVIVHHSGLAAAERGRGSSALRGAMDFEFGCDKSTDDDVEDTVVTLTNRKVKDHDAPPPMAFKPVLVDLKIVDEDMQPLMSIVLEQTEAEPAKKKKLSLASQIAIDALKALTVHGEDSTESLWRAECYARGIATTDKPDAKQKAFSRARNFLLSSHMVGTRDDLYWITSSDKIEPGHPDRTGQDRTCPGVSPLDNPDGQDTHLKVCPSVRSEDENLSEKEKKDFTAENDQNGILSVDIKNDATPDDEPGIIDHDRHGHFDETEFEEFEI